MKKKLTAVTKTANREPVVAQTVHPQTDLERRDAAIREKVVREIYDTLAPFEVAAPPAWVGCTTPDVIYPGQCFDRSYHFTLAVSRTFPPNDPAEKEVWLVHGEYRGFHRHAWVELPGGVVFDGTNQRFYDRTGYYEAVGARPWYMYSPLAAFWVAVRMPESEDGMIRLADWHGDLKLPWADPENPTRIDYPEVLALMEKSGLKRRPTRGRKQARPAS